ncbi:MAG TPA: hypothetical protein VHC48_19270 [Puia sp.]|nr:hypothetical protein [Puia sp.]
MRSTNIPPTKTGIEILVGWAESITTSVIANAAMQGIHNPI